MLNKKYKIPFAFPYQPLSYLEVTVFISPHRLCTAARSTVGPDTSEK